MHDLKIENLTFAYDKKLILDDVSINFETEQFTGIIGPNGSGKTTLAKLISKLLKVDIQTVYLNLNDINSIKIAELARTMAMVPQASQINYDLTVYEVVLMGRTPHLKRFQKESETDLEIVESVMKETDTWQFRDRMIHQLSGGERQRVIIARALAQEPKILILDEPVTYLDVHHQLQIMNLIKDLSKDRKMTIVMILHDLNYALTYCDQVILLSEGKVFKSGSPLEVITIDHIKKVYKIDVSIIEHPIRKQPMVIF